MKNNKRKEEILSMKLKTGLSNEKIGKVFGISRERVRQIIGNTGRRFQSNWRNKIIESCNDLTNDELAQKLNIRSDVVAKHRKGARHEISGGTSKIGADSENYVSLVLKNNGIKHELMHHSHPFDVLLSNGKKADIKSSANKINPPSALGNPYYVFNVRKEQKKLLDFYILLIIPTKDIFIIPAKNVNSSIHLVWPPVKFKRFKTSKWTKYHNKFDLLK
jgi:DNA-binding CsgD family transcriptional regulator